MSSATGTRIVHGERGLVYLTHTDAPGLFIAAKDSETAVALAKIAVVVLKGAAAGDGALRACADAVPCHRVIRHLSGLIVTLPTPQWQTTEQRGETDKRFETHLALSMPVLGAA